MSYNKNNGGLSHFGGKQFDTRQLAAQEVDHETALTTADRDRSTYSNRDLPLQQQESQGRREILTLTIEIGEGQNENILICEGDDPFTLAEQFAQKHKIGGQLRDLLGEQIRLNIEQVLQE